MDLVVVPMHVSGDVKNVLANFREVRATKRAKGWMELHGVTEVLKNILFVCLFVGLVWFVLFCFVLFCFVFYCLFFYCLFVCLFVCLVCFVLFFFVLCCFVFYCLFFIVCLFVCLFVCCFFCLCILPQSSTN